MIIKNILNKFKPKLQRINELNACMYKLNNNLHNPHRPAVKQRSGYKAYLLNDHWHNIVGPARIFKNGDVEYIIKSREIE